MVLAVTLHDIPEDMAVGVVYVGFLSGSAGITVGGRWCFLLGLPSVISLGGDAVDIYKCLQEKFDLITREEYQNLDLSDAAKKNTMLCGLTR